MFTGLSLMAGTEQFSTAIGVRLISLNLSSASLRSVSDLDAHLSGCYFIASFLNAFLISCSVADLETPSIS